MIASIEMPCPHCDHIDYRTIPVNLNGKVLRVIRCEVCKKSSLLAVKIALKIKVKKLQTL